MQSSQAGHNTGSVVQWIAPPNKRPKSCGAKVSSRVGSNGFGEASQSALTGSRLARSHLDDHEDKENQHQNPSNSSHKPIHIDTNLCKVICTFVDEHLKELHQHQQLITEARLCKKNNENSQSIQSSSLSKQPSGDSSALKVRDEQTKANTTIKQLTNYLKELTFLQGQCNNSNTHQINEDMVCKLTDTRARIIKALNEFIASNKDYDLPIEDCFGTDAQTNDFKLYEVQVDDVIEGSLSGTTAARILEPAIVVINEDGQEELFRAPMESHAVVEAQLCDIERHKRDVMKLQRDTEEMKRLFTEFYSLIKSQGDQVDSIEENIMITAHHISEGHNSLRKTKKSLMILVPVTGCMAGALIGGPLGLVVGGKLGGLTMGCVTSILGLFSSFGLRRCIGFDKIKSD